MEVFNPSGALIYPYQRKGGIAPTLKSDQENGTSKFRRQWLTGATELQLQFKGSKSEIDTDIAFIESHGGYTPFKFKDFYDYEIEDEAIGTGTGTQTVFYFEEKCIDTANMSVYVDSVLQTYTTDYVVSDETGRITFATAPGIGLAVTGDYEFYRKYHFQLFKAADLSIAESNLVEWSFSVNLLESII